MTTGDWSINENHMFVIKYLTLPWLIIEFRYNVMYGKLNLLQEEKNNSV